MVKTITNKCIRRQCYSALVLFAFLVASCSSTSTDFTAYKDNTVFLGHGGVDRSVNGIDFWMDGSPDRKFRIIGVVSIKQEKGHSLPLPGMLNQLSQLPQMAQSSPESHLASEAKAHGGDAVIIIQPTHDKPDDSSNGPDFDNAAYGGGISNGDGSKKHSHSTEAYIIKYVDEGN